MMMEVANLYWLSAVYSSETLACTYKLTWRYHREEDRHRYIEHGRIVIPGIVRTTLANVKHDLNEIAYVPHIAQ